MKSQKLTKRQYRKTNWSMYIIMVLSSLLCTGIDVSNMSKAGFTTMGIGRCVLYLLFIPVLLVMNKFLCEKKIAMILMAVSYLIMYPVCVFGN